RDVSRQCRTRSQKRKTLRQFDIHKQNATELIGIAAQRAIPSSTRYKITTKARAELSAMAKISKLETVEEDAKRLDAIVERLKGKLEKTVGLEAVSDRLKRLRKDKREIYERVFGLIYECSANRVVAKGLVDRILAKI